MEKTDCDVAFETREQKIRKVFSTAFILNCVAGNNLVVYNDIFLDTAVQEVLKNEAIIQTAKLFMDNNLNLSKASQNCFLHRNTMVYRLRKILVATGLDIRKFEDAVLFSNMLELFKDFA